MSAPSTSQANPGEHSQTPSKKKKKRTLLGGKKKKVSEVKIST